jgi:hypothetical protein
MSDKDLVSQAKDIAGGTSDKLASLIGWSKASVDAWASSRSVPPGAKVIMSLMIEVPAVREWMWQRRIAPKRAAKKGSTK